MNERVGNVQRTQVLDILSRALEEGYLDLAEFDQRTSIVTAAKTADQLVGQVVDLPPQFHWDPRAAPPPAVPLTKSSANTHTAAVASLVLAIASIPLAVCFGFGAVFGIAAIVLSRPGLRSTSDYGKAVTGLVLGCFGIVASIGMILLLIFVPSTSTTR